MLTRIWLAELDVFACFSNKPRSTRASVFLVSQRSALALVHTRVGFTHVNTFTTRWLVRELAFTMKVPVSFIYAHTTIETRIGMTWKRNLMTRGPVPSVPVITNTMINITVGVRVA